ncbi:MAG TPA: adenylate/guanylate cyclase domain-containing protein [Acidimicrobiia bacterium]
MDAVTGYAKNGGTHIAYSVLGDGPVDVLAVSTMTVATEAFAEEPHAAAFDRRLASFCRLIRFDLRGIGLSDPIDLAAGMTLSDIAGDALAVLDAVGVSSATLLGTEGGVVAAITLAATAPDRVDRLVLINGFARVIRADDYPHGHPPELVSAFVETNIDPDAEWSLDGADDLALIAPSLKDDPAFVAWWVRSSRRGASPATALAMLRLTSQSDVRDLLSTISMPTLVLHRRANFFTPVGCGRYLGEHIAGAKYVELAGADHLPWAGDADEILDEIEEFLTGQRSGTGERVLTTVLFTDIVDSTGQAAALGDRAWRARLENHDAIVRQELRRYGGREVKTTGDGFLAAFDSPTQAARCARAVVDASSGAQLEVRVGIHTGECERRGGDLVGLAVHIAARVAAAAGAGEVMVSRTVRDLVGGSEMRFVDHGEHELKGVPERWQLFGLIR